MNKSQKKAENQQQYQEVNQDEKQPFYDKKQSYSDSVHPIQKPNSLYPQPTYCESCYKQIISEVKFKAGIGTYVCSLVICLCGGIFGCCLIPCCINDCQDAKHYCPICKRCLGRKQFLIQTDE